MQAVAWHLQRRYSAGTPNFKGKVAGSAFYAAIFSPTVALHVMHSLDYCLTLLMRTAVRRWAAISATNMFVRVLTAPVAIYSQKKSTTMVVRDYCVINSTFK